MKQFIRALSILGLASLGLIATTGVSFAQEIPAVDSAQPELKWLDNSQQVLDLAKKEGKPVLIDFTGSDWCGWCIRLKKEVLNTPEFAAFASENLVLQIADFPKRIEQSAELKTQNRALAEKYGIRGFPTLIILNSEGKQIGQMGYMRGGPQPFIAQLQKIIDKK